MCIYTRERHSVVPVCMCNSSSSMSFLDIKALVDEYVKAMKTVRKRNMVNREMKLAIGEELQTLFHPIGSATKQDAEKTVEELDNDGALKTEHHTTLPPTPPQKDLTFGIHATGEGRYAMGNSIVHIEVNTLKVDDKEYELTPGLRMLMLYKKPRPQHYTSDDYSVYKAIAAQTSVRAYLNKRTGSARPRSTWKWKHMLSGMVIPGDAVEGEDEESTEGVSSDGYRTPSPSSEEYVFKALATTPPSAGKTRKKRKTREPFYKVYGVVYLPGDIKGLTDKLRISLAEFIAGNTTVRNELVYVLDELLRLKQLTRREYTDINNRLASA